MYNNVAVIYFVANLLFLHLCVVCFCYVTSSDKKLKLPVADEIQKFNKSFLHQTHSVDAQISIIFLNMFGNMTEEVFKGIYSHHHEVSAPYLFILHTLRCHQRRLFTAICPKCILLERSFNGFTINGLYRNLSTYSL